MNKNNKMIMTISMNAMIAAIYAALTLMIQPLAYRELQFRLSEVIVLLAFYNKNLIPGLAVGCFIANTASPLGIVDMFVGTVSTIVVCYGMNKVSHLYLSALLGSVATGLIVGAELSIVYHMPYLINAFYVFLGEAVVLFIGTIIFKKLEKNERFMEYINGKI